MIALKINVDLSTYVGKRSLEAQMPAKAHPCPQASVFTPLHTHTHTHCRLLYHTALFEAQRAQLFTKLSIDLLFDIEKKIGLRWREGDSV